MKADINPAVLTQLESLLAQRERYMSRGLVLPGPTLSEIDEALLNAVPALLCVARELGRVWAELEKHEMKTIGGVGADWHVADVFRSLEAAVQRREREPRDV